MKTLFKLLVLFLIEAPFALKAQFNHRWSQAIGGGGYDLGNKVKVDDNGNIFVTGSFRDTTDFDPSSSSYNLISKGAGDGYLAKYSATGELAWAHSFGSPGRYASTINDVTSAIATDGYGNVYIGINFGSVHPFGIVDTMDVDPGPDTVNIINARVNNGILAKFDAQGNFIWAIHLPATGVSDISAISIDAFGNVYAVGAFRGAVDFDAGPDSLNITSAGGSDIYFMKYSASGDLIWVRTIGGLADEAGYDLVIDPAGNIFITGNFKGTVDFDPGAGVAELTGDLSLFDIFFAKYDAEGNYQWARAINPAGLDVPCGVVSDEDGNVIVSGIFNDAFDFDPGIGVASLVANGGKDIFIAKYSGEGNFLWAKAIGGSSGAESPNDIKSDGEGGFYITGTFNNTVDFNPGGMAMPLISNGAGDIYFARYNANGICVGAGHAGGSSHDMGMGISLISANNILVTGNFGGVADFDPGTGVINLTSAGPADIFFAQYELGSPVPVELISFTAQCNSNAVLIKWATASEQNNAGFEIEKSSDGIKFNKIAFVNGTGNSNLVGKYDYTDPETGTSAAFYRIKQIDKDGKFQYTQVVKTTCIQRTNLSAYPNPASNILKVAFDSRVKNGEVQVLGLKGVVHKKILFHSLQEGKLEINVSSLLPGTYLIRLQSADLIEPEVVKFLKLN